MPRAEPCPASVTSVPAKRHHPGDLTPQCVGSWAAGSQQPPCKGAGEELACCQGCCASSHPCCCLTVKVTRYKAAIRGKSWCSASVQHTGFPLLLSPMQESLNVYPELPIGPLSLASRELMDRETGMLILGWTSHCSVTPQVLSALPK